MHALIFITLTLIFSGVKAQGMTIQCPPNSFQAWTQSAGYTCVPRMTAYPVDPILACLPNMPTQTPWLGAFPGILTPHPGMPWWAVQGNLHFPNLHYPGAWAYPGIQARHYPGNGEVFAAKPNVYIESIHNEKKFEFRFTSPEKPSFLVTTPPLDRKLHHWVGKIVSKDKFEVEGIFYDYLFYDVRLPKEKMQFEYGGCATRSEAIEWMLEDLKDLRFSPIARQDFDEHWRVKIPDYPFYCIYPQYNQQLDAALPVSISLEQTSFTRVLYVMVPHKEAPDVDKPQMIPLPNKVPEVIRPEVKITRENMFKEWGVAFLGFD